MCLTYIFKSGFDLKLFVHLSDNDEHKSPLKGPLMASCKMTLEKYLSLYASCQLCLSVIKTLYSVLHHAFHGYECFEMFLYVFRSGHSIRI